MSEPRDRELDLSVLGTSQLRELMDTLRRGVPLSRSMLRERLDELHTERLWSTLRKLDAATQRLLIGAVLADRERHERPAPYLVYSGPDVDHTPSRSTGVLLGEVWAEAEDEVLIAGYSFDHPRQILAGLHERMQNRSLRVRIFMNLRQERVAQGGPQRLSEEAVMARAREEAARIWPFSGVQPEFYVDARYIDASHFLSMHAKCVVVDRRHALVGSANFTDRAHSRNVEIGVYLREDHRFARDLDDRFRALVDEGHFVRVAWE